MVQIVFISKTQENAIITTQNLKFLAFMDQIASINSRGHVNFLIISHKCKRVGIKSFKIIISFFKKRVNLEKKGLNKIINKKMKSKMKSNIATLNKIKEVKMRNQLDNFMMNSIKITRIKKKNNFMEITNKNKMRINKTSHNKQIKIMATIGNNNIMRMMISKCLKSLIENIIRIINIKDHIMRIIKTKENISKTKMTLSIKSHSPMETEVEAETQIIDNTKSLLNNLMKTKILTTNNNYKVLKSYYMISQQSHIIKWLLSSINSKISTNLNKFEGSRPRPKVMKTKRIIGLLNRISNPYLKNRINLLEYHKVLKAKSIIEQVVKILQVMRMKSIIGLLSILNRIAIINMREDLEEEEGLSLNDKNPNID